MLKLGQSISVEVQEELGQMADKLGQADPNPTTGTGEVAERVALFIDGENLIPRFGANSGVRFHFGRLRDLLAAGRPVNLAQWFDSYKDDAERGRKKRLYFALGLSGFTVRALPLRNGHKLKSRIDSHVQAEITEQLLLEDRGKEPYTHTFILASGDSDFHPMIEVLKRHGRRVEVAYLGNTLSHELRCAADRLIDLGEHLEELALDGKAVRDRSNGLGQRHRQWRQGLPSHLGQPTRAGKVVQVGREYDSSPVVVTVVPSRRTRLSRRFGDLKKNILRSK